MSPMISEIARVNTHPARGIRGVSRRRFLRIVAFGGLAAGLGAATVRRLAPTAARASRVLMGTVVNLAIVSDDERRAIEGLTAAFAEMERLIALFDHRRPESTLGRLNASGSLSEPPAEFVEVLAHALALSALTDGAFDVTVHPVIDAYRDGMTMVDSLRERIDYRLVALSDREVRLGRPGMALTFDGLAKGRVVDGAVGALRALGFERVLVEAGGDLFASRTGIDGQPWRIGIRDPHGAADNAVLTFGAADLAVATSGDYLNAFTIDHELHHIIDPRTLRSPAELSSATALAPTAMAADALSTALLVLGVDAGLALAESLPGVEALLITKDDRRVATSGFPTA